ncbi:FtsX-like permease family protein [endosymbiont 'TC1' of Trimyema compressum]|uniref:FtsX-like permease family protein n=1 Tax=endosymbiont 'TC1' of Trimyema compressum TaxID=243899 RepID=UPI000B4CF33A
MKVLGAPISAIRQMFLCEAGFIGITGGVLGILVGIVITYLLGNLLAWLYWRWSGHRISL